MQEFAVSRLDSSSHTKTSSRGSPKCDRYKSNLLRSQVIMLSSLHSLSKTSYLHFEIYTERHYAHEIEKPPFLVHNHRNTLSFNHLHFSLPFTHLHATPPSQHKIEPTATALCCLSQHHYSPTQARPRKRYLASELVLEGCTYPAYSAHRILPRRTHRHCCTDKACKARAEKTASTKANSGPNEVASLEYLHQGRCLRNCYRS